MLYGIISVLMNQQYRYGDGIVIFELFNEPAGEATAPYEKEVYGIYKFLVANVFQKTGKATGNHGISTVLYCLLYGTARTSMVQYHERVPEGSVLVVADD